MNTHESSTFTDVACDEAEAVDGGDALIAILLVAYWGYCFYNEDSAYCPAA